MIGREPVIAQKFIPAVSKGDKRILLVDGEPVGAINRVPAEGQVRSNLARGGRAEAVELTARDREICAAIGPELKRAGPAVRRHRRDRRLPDRDQRHLAHRRPAAEALRRRRRGGARCGTGSRRSAPMVESQLSLTPLDVVAGH